jgi:hypothetical protein
LLTGDSYPRRPHLFDESPDEIPNGHAAAISNSDDMSKSSWSHQSRTSRGYWSRRIGRDIGANLYEDEAMRFLVMLAGFAAVLGVATPAQADPGNSGRDASFLAALNKAGITYQDPTVAVAVARKACELMDQGNPQAGVIKSVSSSNPGFTTDGAAQFTMIAASAYCPQHMGQSITQAPPTPLDPAGSPR